MHINKKVKRILIVVLLAFIAFQVYKLIAPKSDTANQAESTKNGLINNSLQPAVSPKQESIERLLSLLLSVNTIKLNSQIFNTSEFRSLKDFSLTDEQQSLDLSFGRANPFLPIGDESAGALVAPQPSSTTGLVKTSSVTNIAPTSVVLTGDNTYSNTQEQYFEWGSTGVAPLGQTTPAISKTGNTFSYSLGNLLPDTTYYYRAVVKTKDGKLIVGEIKSFKTAKS